MKIVNVDGYNFGKIKILRNLNEIFRKDVIYDDIKRNKKPGRQPFSRRYIFGKQRGSN